ncbi:MAG: glycosyltransferase [Chitinophagaceae bacterium]|nr:glycosyltransferase [Chitinophagaceae bacterium]
MLTISIITATYNSSSTLQQTLESVAMQSHQNIEHIIVDGLSKDSTLEVVNQFPHVSKIISEKDHGIYDAMNKGIQTATGDIIGILNSDDFYVSNDILQQIAEVFKTTNCDVLYGDLNFVDSNDISKIKRKWIAGSYTLNDFLFGWMPPHPTFFVRKKVYEQYGLFNLSLGSAADYELMLRFMYKHQLKGAYLNKIIVHFRLGGASTKNLNNRVKANINDRKAWLVNNLKPKWFTLHLKPLRKIKQFF